MSRPRVSALGASLLLVVAACGPGGGVAAGGVCDGEITVDTVTMFAHEGSEADAYRGAIEAFNETQGAELGCTVERP